MSGRSAPTGARLGCSRSVRDIRSFTAVCLPPTSTENEKAGHQGRPIGKLDPALLVNDHQRADPDAFVEVGNIFVGETNAARGNGLADSPRLRGAVDAVERRADIERPGA